MNSRGFTLVELLIVIAVIGVLASVIIPRLNTARHEGVAAKLSAEAAGLEKRASAIQIQTFSFDPVCGSGGVSQDQQISTFINSMNDVSPGSVTCNSSATAYAVSVPLPPDSSEHYCIDSTGTKTRQGAALSGGSFTCS